MEFQPRLRPSILYLRGAIAISYMLFCLLAPRPSILLLTVMSAAFLLADGAATLFIRGPELEHTRAPGWAQLTGVLGILAATVAFLYPEPTTISLGLFTGAWAFFAGGLQIAGGVQSRDDVTVPSDASLIFGLLGGVTMLLGGLLLFQTWLALVTTATLLGATAGVRAISSLYLGLRIRSFLRQSAPPVEHQPTFRRSA